ncbi:hypothetical protein Ahy_B06g080300 [Arachis hypogaea]|uniref:cytokinin dehydrogenase n=1 Tax=Arachis hypogaea TaxID=3818 RepID=A0A444YHM9_ARAHY|nr:hypothetical protein Ahy_B06g080300 [Arachis hypogaea]
MSSKHVIIVIITHLFTKFLKTFLLLISFILHKADSGYNNNSIGTSIFQRPYHYDQIVSSLQKLPLDGSLSLSNNDAVASDFGNIYHFPPLAVLNPVSVSDISRAIKHVTELSEPGLKVAARGHGHSLQGQSQAEGGIVINMESLAEKTAAVVVVNNGEFVPYVDVSAGELWINILHETLKHGLAPKSWTDYLHLTVGGTLSNAGISGQAFRHGPQINNVFQLEVVTGYSSAVKLEIEKFDGRINFGLWQVQVKDVLIQSGLHKALKEKISGYSSAVKLEIEKFDGRINFGLWQVQVNDVLIQSGLHKALKEKISGYSSAVKLEIEKFDGRINFGLWQIQVKDVLIQSGLHKALKEKISGKGEVVTCSETRNTELYYSVLGGLGQFGIITRARISLEAAPKTVKWIRMLYSEFSMFARDQEYLISLENTFDYIEGFVIINRTGILNNWRSSFNPRDPLQASQFISDGRTFYCLEVAKYFNPDETQFMNQIVENLLSELSYIPWTLFQSENTTIS